MEHKFDISEKLDFSEVDLTAPNLVVEELLLQLAEQTDGIVVGKIEAYDGIIESYTTKSFSALAEALSPKEVIHDIQNDLGETGKENKKFECYIYTPIYEHYKFRVFFMKYNISCYPVKLVIEKSVFQSITNGSSYVIECNNRQELEEFLIRIFNSDRLISIMQELIWINQAKKTEKQNENSDGNC